MAITLDRMYHEANRVLREYRKLALVALMFCLPTTQAFSEVSPSIRCQSVRDDSIYIQIDQRLTLNSRTVVDGRKVIVRGPFRTGSSGLTVRLMHYPEERIGIRIESYLGRDEVVRMIVYQESIDAEPKALVIFEDRSTSRYYPHEIECQVLGTFQPQRRNGLSRFIP